MFSGLASFLPWSGAKGSTTGSVDMDLERGDRSRSHIDDDRLSSVGSFRVADSYTSSTAEVNQERALPGPPQDELDTDNDLSTSGCGVGPSSEESVSAAVPGFLPPIGRSASTPPEILRVNPPPDSILQQLQDQDHIYSATTSSSSASSDHSYTRFFHRSRTPKRTRSLGPGGIHTGLSVLSPIYEPSNPDLRGLASTQREGEAGGSSTPQKKTDAPSIHSTTSTIQEKITCLQATRPAFLKRSLKRSLSPTSSNSLHPEASGVPQLPPLHFRPAFIGIAVGTTTSPTSTPSPGPPNSCRTPYPPTVVVPTRTSPSTTSPQRSQPNTPQSLTTPRSHRFGFTDHSQKCSAIYEDSPSEKSFVTASNGGTEPDPGVMTKHDMPSTAELIIYHQDQDQEQTEQELEHIEEHERVVREQPSSSNVGISALEQRKNKRFSDSETTFNVAPDPKSGPSTVPATVQKPRGTGTVSVMSIASTTVRNESVVAEDGVVEETATLVEDDQFIMERWTKTLFYSASGGKELLSTANGGEGKQYPVSSTCVLFWVGFVAPWCWLVGGWMMLPRDASLRESETRKLNEKVSVDVGRGTVPQGEEGGSRKRTLPDPSSSFKTTARAPSIPSTTISCSKEVGEARIAAADPWIRRCRIASIVGGAILGLALIAMAIVLAVVME